MEKIPVCTEYKIENKITKDLPFNLDSLDIIPIYKDFNGWKNFSNAETDLPSEFMNYVKNIEKSTETPVAMVSVGADRTQTIVLYDFMK